MGGAKLSWEMERQTPHYYGPGLRVGLIVGPTRDSDECKLINRLGRGYRTQKLIGLEFHIDIKMKPSIVKSEVYYARPRVILYW